MKMKSNWWNRTAAVVAAVVMLALSAAAPAYAAEDGYGVRGANGIGPVEMANGI
jgi:hypothetical protein